MQVTDAAPAFVSVPPEPDSILAKLADEFGLLWYDERNKTPGL